MLGCDERYLCFVVFEACVCIYSVTNATNDLELIVSESCSSCSFLLSVPVEYFVVYPLYECVYFFQFCTLVAYIVKDTSLEQNVCCSRISACTCFVLYILYIDNYIHI